VLCSPITQHSPDATASFASLAHSRTCQHMQNSWRLHKSLNITLTAGTESVDDHALLVSTF